MVRHGKGAGKRALKRHWYHGMGSAGTLCSAHSSGRPSFGWVGDGPAGSDAACRMWQADLRVFLGMDGIITMDECKIGGGQGA